MPRYIELQPRTHSSNGSRGGIGEHHHDLVASSYALEIGGNCKADTKLLAVAAHADEIMELTRRSDSPLARLVWRSIDALKRQLDDKLKEGNGV